MRATGEPKKARNEPIISHIAIHWTSNAKEQNGCYRLFHSNYMDYTFLSEAQESFSKIGHILGHKASLNK